MKILLLKGQSFAAFPKIWLSTILHSLAFILRINFQMGSISSALLFYIEKNWKDLFLPDGEEEEEEDPDFDPEKAKKQQECKQQ